MVQKRDLDFFLIRNTTFSYCGLFPKRTLSKLTLPDSKGCPLNKKKTLVLSSSIFKWLLKLLTHQTTCFIILACIYSRVYWHSLLMCGTQGWRFADRSLCPAASSWETRCEGTINENSVRVWCVLWAGEPVTAYCEMMKEEKTWKPAPLPKGNYVVW